MRLLLLLTIVLLALRTAGGEVPRPKEREALQPQGRPTHPTVFCTPADIARARRNAEQHDWARATRERILQGAARWLERSEQDWLRLLPGPGACYAYGFTGCPICGAPWGTWGGAACSWDKPGQVTCRNGHALPDREHPDPGTGYHGPDGRIHYFVGSWNAWATEQWTNDAIPTLARAYALTGDERFAERAAFFLDALASIYPESTAGSWDYPSTPPSGRLARPWYQVARTLVVYVEAYDLIYSSPVLDRPSLRPALEASRSAGPPPQTLEVRTPPAHGFTEPGLTRRRNIDRNLMEDGAWYCYAHTFDGRLHNGHADYLRGALAVGCLLGIPEYVRWATEGPYSIYAMLDNNVDRDGRYYETSLPYAHHTRSLYLTFAEPLANWRDEAHPDGIDLYADPRFQRFYLLPDLVMDCAGHPPAFGDASPDNRPVTGGARRYSPTDYILAEHMYAGSRRPQDKNLFAGVLALLAGADLDKARAASNLGAWLLFHGDALPPGTSGRLPASIAARLEGSWFLGQKGIALLRTGQGDGAQAALLRWGPTLNHGDLDELGLLYYGGGWQLTYDIGYGLGSTHTHIGWANQTASHTGVVVDETSQLIGPGSGGTLHLLAATPGFQAAEASDPNAYRKPGVQDYRRTIALIGGESANDPAYLVDIFRVVGGSKHDYFLGAQTQNYQVERLALGTPLPGSLAGPDISWGTQIGNGGDIKGYPNKPYWNPPPQNGYGFFYDVRPGEHEGSWSITWSLGGPLGTKFRAHFLPPAGSKALVAKAPGLYPERGYGVAGARSASYAVLRREGAAPLASTFVAVMEPRWRSQPAGLLPPETLEHRLVRATAETKRLADLGVLLLKGTKAGDRMEIALTVPKTGRYRPVVNLLRAPSYGAARFVVDGKAVGQADAWAAEISGPQAATFQPLALTRGRHVLAVEMTEPARPEKGYYLGLAGAGLQPVTAPALPPGIKEVARLSPVCGTGAGQPVGVKVVHRDGTTDYLLSGPQEGEGSCYRDGNLVLEVAGALAYARLDPQGRVVRATLAGADRLRIGSWQLRVPAREYAGTVEAVDPETGRVQVAGALPKGLAGSLVLFWGKNYSRAAVHCILAAGGDTLDLGPGALVLGRGLVAAVPDGQTLLGGIPHEYACPVGGSGNSRFFDGKLLIGPRGAATRITEVQFGSPMTIRVEDSRGFSPGDAIAYQDVQPGDRYLVPVVKHYRR